MLQPSCLPALRLMAGALVCTVLAGCTDDGPGTQPNTDTDPFSVPDAGATLNPAVVSVDVVIQGSQLTVLGIEPVDEDFPATKEPEVASDPAVYWEFRGADGSVTRGAIADPRVVISDFAADGTAEPLLGRAEVARIRLDLPNIGGELHLFEPAQQTLSLHPQLFGWNPGISIGWTNIVQKVKDFFTGNVEGLAKIVDHGTCARFVNILIMSEGYTAEEMQTFRADAERVAQYLQTASSDINVWLLEIPSKESGISDPMNGISKDTAFGAAFGDDKNRPRRCVLPDSVCLGTRYTRWQAERGSQANVSLLLVNTTEHAGCAQGNTTTVARTAGAPRIAMHELGHGVYSLADEYDYGTCNLNRAQGKPNTTTDPNSPPWKALVNTTEIPTTVEDLSIVGAYEGAAYCAAGAYRAQHTCMMRDSNQEFCKICAAHISDFHAQRASKQPTNTEEECKANPAPQEDAGPGDASVDAPDGQGLSCLGNSEMCPSGTICSWNGPETEYCCKAPFEGTKQCFSDQDCDPGTFCSFGGPPKSYFWCVPPDPSCQ